MTFSQPDPTPVDPTFSDPSLLTENPDSPLTGGLANTASAHFKVFLSFAQYAVTRPPGDMSALAAQSSSYQAIYEQFVTWLNLDYDARPWLTPETTINTPAPGAPYAPGGTTAGTPGYTPVDPLPGTHIV